ncbi:MAG: hypothetical protein AAF693_03480 [Bacteroidota bacterium]
MTKLFAFLPFTIILLSLDTKGQMHIGISADFGNAVEYSGVGSLLKKPAAPSGSIIFFMKEQIDKQWSLQYGGSLGTLGYWIQSSGDADTLSTLNDPDFLDWYSDYSTIYASGHLVFGRSIINSSRLPKLELFLGAGFYVLL